MQNIIEAHKELADLIEDEIPQIKHIDMWYNQLDFETEEYPFSFPALFLDYNSMEINTNGEQVQEIVMIIDVYLFVETIEDTHQTSEQRDSALSFNDILIKIHQLLQAKSGENFSNLNRIAIKNVPSPHYFKSYVQSYKCIIIDYTAKPEYEEGAINSVTVEKGTKPADTEDKMFIIPTE